MNFNPLQHLATIENCTGCMACVDTCPKEALACQERGDGHIYPAVDLGLCIGCKRCTIVCETIHSSQYALWKEGSIPFAVYSNDETIYRNATSGGVFAAMAEIILQDGGVVYGAAYDANYGVKHVRVDNICDLHLLQGSKYMQSNVSGTYRAVSEDLSKGMRVLFTGTGCQVAAMLAYTKKNKNARNLFTMDLICGGVSSALLMEKFVEHQQPHMDSIVGFRNKSRYEFTYLSDGKKITKRRALPLIGFCSSLTNRYSCYHCEFAGAHRASDWTIGDYWGDKSDKHRSVCICHNERAIALLCRSNTTREMIDWTFVFANPRSVNGKVPFMHRLERRHIETIFRRCSYKTLCKIYASDIKITDLIWMAYKVYKYILHKIYSLESKQKAKQYYHIYLKDSNMNKSLINVIGGGKSLKCDDLGQASLHAPHFSQYKERRVA